MGINTSSSGSASKSRGASKSVVRASKSAARSAEPSPPAVAPQRKAGAGSTSQALPSRGVSVNAFSAAPAAARSSSSPPVTAPGSSTSPSPSPANQHSGAFAAVAAEDGETMSRRGGTSVAYRSNAEGELSIPVFSGVMSPPVGRAGTSLPPSAKAGASLLKPEQGKDKQKQGKTQSSSSGGSNGSGPKWLRRSPFHRKSSTASADTEGGEREKTSVSAAAAEDDGGGGGSDQGATPVRSQRPSSPDTRKTSQGLKETNVKQDEEGKRNAILEPSAPPPSSGSEPSSPIPLLRSTASPRVPGGATTTPAAAASQGKGNGKVEDSHHHRAEMEGGGQENTAASTASATPRGHASLHCVNNHPQQLQELRHREDTQDFSEDGSTVATDLLEPGSFHGGAGKRQPPSPLPSALKGPAEVAKIKTKARVPPPPPQPGARGRPASLAILCKDDLHDSRGGGSTVLADEDAPPGVVSATRLLHAKARVPPPPTLNDSGGEDAAAVDDEALGEESVPGAQQQQRGRDGHTPATRSEAEKIPVALQRGGVGAGGRRLPPPPPPPLPPPPCIHVDSGDSRFADTLDHSTPTTGEAVSIASPPQRAGIAPPLALPIPSQQPHHHHQYAQTQAISQGEESMRTSEVINPRSIARGSREMRGPSSVLGSVSGMGAVGAGSFNSEMVLLDEEDEWAVDERYDDHVNVDRNIDDDDDAVGAAEHYQRNIQEVETPMSSLLGEDDEEEVAFDLPLHRDAQLQKQKQRRQWMRHGADGRKESARDPARHLSPPYYDRQSSFTSQGSVVADNLSRGTGVLVTRSGCTYADPTLGSNSFNNFGGGGLGGRRSSRRLHPRWREHHNRPRSEASDALPGQLEGGEAYGSYEEQDGSGGLAQVHDAAHPRRTKSGLLPRKQHQQHIGEGERDDGEGDAGGADAEPTVILLEHATASMVLHTSDNMKGTKRSDSEEVDEEDEDDPSGFPRRNQVSHSTAASTAPTHHLSAGGTPLPSPRFALGHVRHSSPTMRGGAAAGLNSGRGGGHTRHAFAAATTTTNDNSSIVESSSPTPGARRPLPPLLHSVNTTDSIHSPAGAAAGRSWGTGDCGDDARWWNRKPRVHLPLQLSSSSSRSSSASSRNSEGEEDEEEETDGWSPQAGVSPVLEGSLGGLGKGGGGGIDEESGNEELAATVRYSPLELPMRHHQSGDGTTRQRSSLPSGRGNGGSSSQDVSPSREKRESSQVLETAHLHATGGALQSNRPPVRANVRRRPPLWTEPATTIATPTAAVAFPEKRQKIADTSTATAASPNANADGTKKALKEGGDAADVEEEFAMAIATLTEGMSLTVSVPTELKQKAEETGTATAQFFAAVPSVHCDAVDEQVSTQRTLMSAEKEARDELEACEDTLCSLLVSTIDRILGELQRVQRETLSIPQRPPYQPHHARNESMQSLRTGVLLADEGSAMTVHLRSQEQQLPRPLPVDTDSLMHCYSVSQETTWLADGEGEEDEDGVASHVQRSLSYGLLTDDSQSARTSRRRQAQNGGRGGAVRSASPGSAPSAVAAAGKATASGRGGGGGKSAASAAAGIGGGGTTQSIGADVVLSSYDPNSTAATNEERTGAESPQPDPSSRQDEEEEEEHDGDKASQGDEESDRLSINQFKVKHADMKEGSTFSTPDIQEEMPAVVCQASIIGESGPSHSREMGNCDTSSYPPPTDAVTVGGGASSDDVVEHEARVQQATVSKEAGDTKEEEEEDFSYGVALQSPQSNTIIGIRSTPTTATSPSTSVCPSAPAPDVSVTHAYHSLHLVEPSTDDAARTLDKDADSDNNEEDDEEEELFIDPAFQLPLHGVVDVFNATTTNAFSGTAFVSEMSNATTPISPSTTHLQSRLLFVHGLESTLLRSAAEPAYISTSGGDGGGRGGDESAARITAAGHRLSPHRIGASPTLDTALLSLSSSSPIAVHGPRNGPSHPKARAFARDTADVGSSGAAAAARRTSGTSYRGLSALSAAAPEPTSILPPHPYNVTVGSTPTTAARSSGVRGSDLSRGSQQLARGDSKSPSGMKRETYSVYRGGSHASPSPDAPGRGGAATSAGNLKGREEDDAAVGVGQPPSTRVERARSPSWAAGLSATTPLSSAMAEHSLSPDPQHRYGGGGGGSPSNPQDPPEQPRRSSPRESSPREGSVGQVVCRYCEKPYSSVDVCSVAGKDHRYLKSLRREEKRIKKQAQQILRDSSQGRVREVVSLLDSIGLVDGKALERAAGSSRDGSAVKRSQPRVLLPPSL